MKVFRPLLVLGAALPMVACGSTESPTDAGTISLSDAPVDMTDARMRPDAGPSNDSFEGAQPVAADGTAVSDAIEVPEDVDFWSFEGNAGDWVVVSTTANAEDDPEMVDTVITLFDSTRTQIAENDDGLPRSSTDSEIVIQLPTTGTYYVEVQEFSSWITDDDIDPEGQGTYQYELGVLTLVDGAAINIDAELGDAAANADPLMFGGSTGNVAFVLGDFDDATDVDVFSFTVPATAGGLLSIDIMPAGPDGYGSTRESGRIWVTDMAGTDVLTRVEPRGMQQIEMSPTLVPGTSYLLFVDAGGGTAGSNDHYVLKAVLGTENPLENEATAGSNDTPATATALTLETADMITRGFIISSLASPTDVDVFSFAVPAGQQINAFCGSQSAGSGVRMLQAQIVDEAGTVLGMGGETAVEGVAITEIMPPAAGTYYLRLSAGSQSPEISGNFVRCGVALAAPAMM